MNEIAKSLIVLGLIVAGIGAFLLSGLGTGWIGRLPGDIAINKPNFKFYFPLTTCILVSAILTFIMWLIRR